MSIFALKGIAVLTMLLDHLASYFPQIFPFWFRGIGRISAPIFVFCLSVGLAHSANRKAYGKRLYLASALMGVGSFVLNMAFPDAPFFLDNRIFSTFFLVATVVELLEELATNEGDKKAKQSKIRLALFALAQVFSVLLCFAAAQAFGRNFGEFCNAIFPNVLIAEGAPQLIVLGVLFYFAGCSKGEENRNRRITAIYLAYCAIELVGTIAVIKEQFAGDYLLLLTQRIQWMELGALPFFLCYNGKKGGESWGKMGKWIFYLFYPLHVYLLFVLASYLS